MRLWKVKKEHKRILQEKASLKKKMSNMDEKIKRASSLEFVELQAKNRLHLAKKEEIVFIFHSNHQVAKPEKNLNLNKKSRKQKN